MTTQLEEMTEAYRTHILWGLSVAAASGDVPGIVDGTVSELAQVLVDDATGRPLVSTETLKRQLFPPTKQLAPSYHRSGGPVSMPTWLYLTICYTLGISTNPYVNMVYDHGSGVIRSVSVAEPAAVG